MEAPTERISRLRRLYSSYRKSREDYEALAIATTAAKKEMEEARARFTSCQEDLIGDLFNGCFGQEWLLDPE